MNETYYIKLTGKVNIPNELEIGHNFKVVLDGSVTSATRSDNEDGTFSLSYTFRPIIAEITKDHGEMVKSKDARSRSTQLRSVLYRIWESNEDKRPSDVMYDEVMKWIIKNADEINEKAKNS